MLEYNALITKQRAESTQTGSKLTEEKLKLMEELVSIPQTEAKRVDERVWNLTPAECLWYAITWKRPKMDKSAVTND
jgi:hypothetical protein